MTSTRVEFQELNVNDGHPSQIEEIASYTYSIAEEGSTTTINNESQVVIEEFSENEVKNSEIDANRSNRKLSRGISIVSITDDQLESSSLKNGEGTENNQAKVTNGVHEEIHSFTAKIEKQKSTSRQSSIRSQNSLDVHEQQQEQKIINGYSRQSSTNTNFEEKSTKLSHQSSINDIQEDKSHKLSRQSSTNSTLEEQSHKVSRQSSINNTLQDQSHKVSRQSSVKSEETDLLSRRGSLKSNGEVIENGTSSSRKNSLEEDSNSRSLSRKNSGENGSNRVLSRKNSEENGSSRNLSRQNSKLNRLNSTRSITEEEDEEEEDEEMRKLFARIKRQRSVLDEILEKQEGKKDNEGKFSHNGVIII